MSSQPVILSRRGILHIFPAFESCNIDDSEEATIYLYGKAEAEANPKFRRYCQRCEGRLNNAD